MTRTCDTTTGAWSGSAIVCTACNPPAAPTDGYVSQQSSSVWVYGCNAGTYSAYAPSTRTCTSSGFTGSAVTCSSCGAGYYCTGNAARAQCAAGTFADPAATRLTASTCSGLCKAGYYCPVGATTATQTRCGGIDKYCRAGAGAPITIAPSDTSVYTVPLTSAVDLREDALACPAQRKCVGGVLFPAVQILNCPTDAQYIGEDKVNTDLGVGFLFSTPTNDVTITQYPLTFTILSVTPSTAGCTWGNGVLSLFSYNTATNRLSVGATALKGDGCAEGFNVKFRAARSADATLYAECTVPVALIDVNEPPVFTAGTCTATRTVEERRCVRD